MKRKIINIIVFMILFSCIVIPVEGKTVLQVLEESGVKGGLIVHVGCGNGELTAQLFKGDNFIVHGLDRDKGNISKARDYIKKLDKYGPVSVEEWDSELLPYNDNIVNLILVENADLVSEKEIIRVLVPNGVAFINKEGKWTKIIKPRPKDIDEWTHYLHGPDNNAVANDLKVATPHRIQWESSPKRTRDHDALASMSALTTSGGRMFYIFDEGPTSLMHHPADWKLIARDAFNGVLLWKRKIDNWITHLYYFRSGPVILARRLVSIKDRVYVTLGFGAPVSVLDAPNGKTLMTFKGSENTEELICHDDVLLTTIGDPQYWNRNAEKPCFIGQYVSDEKPEVSKSVAGFNMKTGKKMWENKGANLKYLVPLSLTAYKDKVFYLDNNYMYCNNLKTGKQLWKSSFKTSVLFVRNFAPTVVAYKDILVCLSYDKVKAYFIKDGKILWEKDQGAIGFGSPADVFIIDGIVWVLCFEKGSNFKPGNEFLGNNGQQVLGIDIKTGEIKRTFEEKDVLTSGHHHRCYRNKATVNYLICGRRGLEFIDVKGDNHIHNWWIRGLCQYGIMPANGYIYMPPNPCKCFNLVKLSGFHTLSSRNSLDTVRLNKGGELKKGPAFNNNAKSKRTTVINPKLKLKEQLWQPPVCDEKNENWPFFRHDITRSGSVKTRVPAEIKNHWEFKIGSKISSPVVSKNKIIVSAIDKNTLYCCDAETGKLLWNYIAEGSIDSPPAIYKGLVIFGSRNGYVSAIQLSDGKLVWKFRGVPIDRRIVRDNRLDSVWPISGSVLVIDDVVYFSAGRSSYLDGGIHVSGLDAFTGKELHKTIISTRAYLGKTPQQDDINAIPSLSDVLVFDGQNINMRHVVFNRELVVQPKAGIYSLLASTGLLEDTWYHRETWSLGISKRPGDSTTSSKASSPHSPFGKLIVFDEQYAYGAQTYYTFLKRDKSLWPPTHEHHLHQKYARYTPEYFPVGTRLFAQPNAKVTFPEQKEEKQEENSGKKRKKKKSKKSKIRVNSTVGHKWTQNVELQVRGMVLTDKILFITGWQDSLKIFDKTKSPSEDKYYLWGVSTEDGKTVSQLKITSAPGFDGLIAAQNKLYMSTADGKLICFK